MVAGMSAVLLPLALANFSMNTRPNEAKFTANSYPGEPCRPGTTVTFNRLDCRFGRTIYISVDIPYEHKYCVCSKKTFDALYLELWDLIDDGTENYGEGFVTPLLSPPVSEANVGLPLKQYCFTNINAISNELKKNEITFGLKSTLSYNGVTGRTDFLHCKVVPVVGSGSAEQE